MAEYELGRLYGLRLSAKPMFFVGFVWIWAALTLIGASVFGLSAAEAILGGLLGVALHYASELWHHLGHAWAARRTGHPMLGMRFGHLLGTMAFSIYPPDEGDLPARVHIRRALGGPLANLLVALLALPLTLALQSSGGLAYALALWLFLENLVIYTLQALVPLGFNDGTTLWTWWRKR
jgi:hypothetical protein